MSLENLGSIKLIDASSTPREFNENLAIQTAAIREVAGDTQRLRERLERILPEAQAALKQAKADSRAEWVPEGETYHAEARYLRPDGAVRLGTSERQILLPNGEIYNQRSYGLLTDPYPVVGWQADARKAYLSYAVAYARARRVSPQNPWGDTILRKAYARFEGALRGAPGKIGNFFRAMFSDPESRKRAISNTSGSGGELIDVPKISDVRRPADLARRIPGLFPMQDVPASSFKQGIVTGRALARKRGKTTTNNPAQYPVVTFTTSDTTLTVIDRVIMALVDPLWAADQGQILDDPMGLVMDWLMRGDLDSLEVAILHGDTAGTHQDSALATWTLGSYYTAGDLDGSDSPAKFWIGLRARAFDDSATVAGGGTFDMTDHGGALDAMGVHAAGAMIFTGLHCYFTQFVANTIFTTVDKMGDRATQITGEVGSIGGKPVIISEFVTNDMPNTGLYTTSGATTYAVYCNPDAWVLADHQGGADDFEQLYADKGANYVGFVRRQLLYPNCISTEKPCSVIINL